MKTAAEEKRINSSDLILEGYIRHWQLWLFARGDQVSFLKIEVTDRKSVV